MSIKLPPRYVNTPVHAIGHELPDAENMTYIRLYALAWKTNGQETPPLELTALLGYLRIGRSALYKRLSRFAEMGWLRSASPRPGFIKLFFSLSPRQQNSSPPPRTPVHADGQSTATDSFAANSARSSTTATAFTTATTPNQKQKAAVAGFSNPEDQARYEVLSALSEPLRSRLARELTKTPKQIQADIARWRQKGTPGLGLLVTMLRNDPPEIDPQSEEARQKYVSGDFADFIEH